MRWLSVGFWLLVMAFGGGQNNPVLAAELTDGDKLVISAAGDCTLGYDVSFGFSRSFDEEFEKNGNDYGYFFRYVQPIFANDDLSIVNLETTLTKASQKASKKYRFKGRPEYARILSAGGVEAVNLANNHTFDYLKPGFEETCQSLTQAGVDYFGYDFYDIRQVGNVKVGLAGFEGFKAQVAGEVEQALIYLKQDENCDIVIVSFHWGQERAHYPIERQISLGHQAIDAGADLVLGHHPHVIQGIEHYQGRSIVYSLGNFCFGGNYNPADKDSFIYQVEFSLSNGLFTNYQEKIIPCRISSVTERNNYQPIVLLGEAGTKVLSRLEKYSQRFASPFQLAFQ